MRVRGGDVLARRLQMLSKEVKEDYMLAAATRGIEVYKQAAIANTPIGETGALRESHVTQLIRHTKARVALKTGPSLKDGWYGLFVEDGHRIMQMGIHVGDVVPHPFMRPVFDSKTDEAFDMVLFELRRRLRGWLWK